MPTRTLLEDQLLAMKNASELMIDLAYSSLIYQWDEIAEEVRGMEDAQDEAFRNLERDVLAAVKEGSIEPQPATALLGLAIATERVADAARDIADVVLRDVEPHPILQASVAQADAVVRRYVIAPGSAVEGVTLGDARVQSDTGMLVFAIRRGSTWIHGPSRDTALSSGDVVLARGPEEGVGRLGALLGSPAEQPEEAT